MEPVSQQLLALFLPFLPIYLRVQFCLIALPMFAETTLNMRVRVALGMACVLPFAGLAPAMPMSDPQLALQQGMAVFLAEALIGLMIALPVRLMSWALGIASTTIAAAASLSQLVGTETEAAPHPIGNLMHLAGIAVLVALGYPIFVLQLLAESFQHWPVGHVPAPGALFSGVVAMFDDSFQLAMVIASPFILGGLLFQALSGVISKVMPSLPIVFIAAPGAILLALVALCVVTPILLSIWADALLGTGLILP